MDGVEAARVEEKAQRRENYIRHVNGRQVFPTSLVISILLQEIWKFATNKKVALVGGGGGHHQCHNVPIE